MEFISNLIKRPMSLVLSDSSDQLHPAGSSANTHTPNISPIELNRDNCVNNENSHSSSMSIKSNNTHIGSDKQDQCHESALEDSVIGTLADISAAGDHELCQQLQSSTSSNATSSTIEELLIQINDNLNKASLEDEYLLPENPNDSNTRLSPLTTKSTTAIKLSPSTRPQIQSSVTPTAFVLHSPTAAAGSATLGTDSTVYKFHIDAELEAELLGESKQLAQENNNNTGVNKSNKFVGLTEFDESNIPELPDSLNPNIDDQLKLTFEEDLIPTFTANSISGLNSTSKRDVSIKGLLVNETDTAVSSDNETFAECLSFQDIINTTTAAKHALEYGDTTEISDADAYRSALNSNNTTIGLEDRFNATLENVESLLEEQIIESINYNQQESVSSIPTKSKEDDGELEGNRAITAADVTFDEVEPMDVDLNETHDLPSTYNPITNEIGRLCCSAVTPTVATTVSGTPEKANSLAYGGNASEHNRLTFSLTRVEEQSNEAALHKSRNSHSLGSLGNVPDHNRLTFSLQRAEEQSDGAALVTSVNSHTLGSIRNGSENNRLTFSLDRDEDQSNGAAIMTPENSDSLRYPSNIALETPEQPNDSNSETENQLERSYMSNNECENVEVPHNHAIARVANECLIQDNSVDSATDVLPVSFEHYVDEPEGISDSTSAWGEKLSEGNSSTDVPIENKTELPHTSHNNVNRNSSLALNVNCSLDMGNQSFPNSPTFPIKPKMEKNQFPRSPVNEKLNKFLEKSDYAEKCWNSPEKTTAARADDLKTVHNLNDTVDIDAEVISNVASARKSPCTPGDSADSIENMNSSSIRGKSSCSNLNDTVDLSDMALPSASIPPQQTTFCESLEDHSDEAIDNNPSTSVDGNSAASKLNDTVDLSDIAVQEISPMTSRPTSFCTSDHPGSSAENTSFSSVNLNGNEIIAPPTKSLKTEIPKKADDKRRTFNISSPPVEDSNKKSENIASSNRFADKRHTFKMSPQQEKENLRRSFEPMDFDESMQFSAAQQFQPISNLILNPSDFDYLLTKGNNNVQVDRSSLLLKFDPLLGKPIPVDQPHLGKILSNNYPGLSPTGEEDEHQNDSNCSFVVDDNFKEASNTLKQRSLEVAQEFGKIKQQEFSQIKAKPKKNVRMSVDVINDMNIENDCKKSIENLNTQPDEKQNNFKMDELEKKIKNEVLKTEDIEKKLKEAELREEALIKRITEKDKTITKMNGVIEAYEKAIAELISEKEQLIQNYEKQLAEVKADRDSNYHHLTSLETTFSDLHVKYEKSKEMTSQLKSSEETLLSEKKQNLENLRLQEKRYEKMKNHAMQQLEIANKKLESLTHEHAIETTKLKALLKKEEISRASINEQLQQKTRENAELVKICDELINGR